jgi:hypothetical protein
MENTGVVLTAGCQLFVNFHLSHNNLAIITPDPWTRKQVQWAKEICSEPPSVYIRCFLNHNA